MTQNPLPAGPRPTGGRLLDARLSLLDRQVLDVHGDPVGPAPSSATRATG